MAFDDLNDDPVFQKAFKESVQGTSREVVEAPVPVISNLHNESSPSQTVLFSIVLVLMVGGFLWIQRKANSRSALNEDQTEVMQQQFEEIEKPKVNKLNYLYLGSVGVLGLKGAVDIATGIESNNALNFLLGVAALGIIVLLVKKAHRQFEISAGTFLLFRFALNTYFLSRMLEVPFADFVTTLPLASLPNLALNYIFPAVLGSCLIRRWSVGEKGRKKYKG